LYKILKVKNQKITFLKVISYQCPHKNVVKKICMNGYKTKINVTNDRLLIMPVSCTNARLSITVQANFCLAMQVNF
jgi:hypothetical protein